MKQKVQSQVQILLFPNQGQGKAVKDSLQAHGLLRKMDLDSMVCTWGSYKTFCARCLSQPGKEKNLKDLCYAFLDRVSQPRLILSSLCNSG